MNPPTAPRAGMALLITVLALLVLQVVVAGVFHTAMQQRRIVNAHARTMQLEAAARSALATALASWSELGSDTLPLTVPTPLVATRHHGGSIRSGASLRRLEPALFLLRGEAEFAATGERRAVAAVLRELTLAEFLGALQAAAVARDAAIGGAVSGAASHSCTLPAEVPVEVPALGLADTTGSAAAGGTVLVTVPPFARFAGLDLQELLSDPPGVLVLEGSDTLRVDGGPALMVVHGDLTLAAGVQFDGLLLVQGSLRMLPGAAVQGAVRVSARLELVEGSIHYEPCVLADLFRAHAFLRGPLRGAAHWWIPAA